MIKDRITARDFASVLAKRSAEVPNRPWIITDEQSYSYRTMDEWSSRLAKGFDGLGIGTNDTVLVMLPDTVDFVLIWCALSKLGAVEVPVNAHYRGNLLTYLINDSEAQTMVLDVSFLERLESVSTDLIYIQRLIIYGDSSQVPHALTQRYEVLSYEDLEADRPWSGCGPQYHDLMSVMYTSGTTGPSKGAMICHAHAYEYAYGVTEMLELQAGDIYYAPLPLFHLAGQFAVIYASCIASATAVITGVFSARSFWADIARFNASCSFLLGAMANFLYQQAPKSKDIQNPLERVLMVPLIPEVEDFKRRFGCLVSTTWGGTEMNCPTRSGFNLIDNKSCGRVANDRYEVRIADENDFELPSGTPGEALVRAKEPWTITAGYWNHPEWTEKAFRNLWYHTGDMLMKDADGNLYFVDRIKDAIRRRGENISSFEVENEINAYPDVLECAVIPVESEHTEQEVMAIVVPSAPDELDPKALVKFLEPRMPYFMVPRYIDCVDFLPKTPTGKIQKYILRDRGVTINTWDREQAGMKLKR
jgi:crotonobetaine/carnitine-CoA ligase